MNKEQNYHISIENLETKRKESFLLAEGGDSAIKISGADNLAPKYQVGKMEYGDLTNHSVWAQSDWSEGGGKKYWEAFRDGYNIFPFTKKYFSKSGLRTVDYPGELRLGSNAKLMDNFPEQNGKISKIKTYGQYVIVAVNLDDKCKMYKTVNGGQDWALIYDSSTEVHNKYSSLNAGEFIEIHDIAIGRPDSTDEIFTKRADPNNGMNLPLNMYDNWYQERRSYFTTASIFFTVVKPGYSVALIMKIPLADEIICDMAYFGEIQIRDDEYEVLSVENDFTSTYPATVIGDIMAGQSYRKLDVDVNVDLFYPGQTVDILIDGSVVSANREIRGIQGSNLVFGNNIPYQPEKVTTVRRSPQRFVVTIDKDFGNMWGSNDFQGNGLPMTAFGLQIRNKSNNKIGYVNASCGSKGYSDRYCCSYNMYDSYDYINYLMKDHNPLGDSYLYLYYKATTVEGNTTINRDGYWVRGDTRKYIVIQNDMAPEDVVVGDKLKMNTTVIIDDMGSRNPIIGLYQRKKISWTSDNKTARNKDIYFNQSSGDTYLYKLKFPNDIYSYNYEQPILWLTMKGEVTAHYVEESQRVLCLATKNVNLVQSYIYEIDDESVGAANSLFDVGEKEVKALVKLNENIYAGTNDKGRIYNWDGRSYEILERFDLDPLTNTANITDAVVFQGKVLFTDNYNGNIMAYDPEIGMFDDLCAPEYIKASGDLITALGVVGGTLFFATNKNSNLMWVFDETVSSDSGHIISSWYNAEMPAIDKKGLYVQILAQDFIKSDAKIRIAFQFDYQDKWYYLSKERGLGFVTEPSSLNEGTFVDFKSKRALYFFFPFNTPKFKTIRYRLEVVGGRYITGSGSIKFFRPVVSNVDVFYILADAKEMLFTYPIKLEDRQQTLGGQGSNEIGKHRDKLEFLLNIWNNDSMVRITHVDGKKYYCIPFKPQQMTGGGMTVVYGNLNSSRKNLNDLSYFVSMMFKNINKIDNYGK